MRKIYWLRLQCFDPSLGHRQAYTKTMNESHTSGYSCQTGSRVVHTPLKHCSLNQYILHIIGI
jgi:hypothetical protein